MGFTFKTEEERNPIQAQPSVEVTKIEELQKKIELYEQFLNDNGYGVLFDVYKDLIEGKVTQEQYNDLTGNVEFDEVHE